MEVIELEKKIEEIEKIVGIDDFSSYKNVQNELDSIKSNLCNKYNAHMLMTIPQHKLENLFKLADPQSKYFSSILERIETINFSEQLIRQRVELIKTFEECLEKAIDTECYSNIEQLQPQLDEEIKVCEELLEKWNTERQVFNEFQRDCGILFRALNQKLCKLQSQVESIQAQREPK